MRRALSRLQAFQFGSLRHRIATLYALLFGAVLVVIMLIVSAGIERFGEASASRDLAANARVFDEIIALRAAQMRGSAEVLGRDFGFREAVATDDRPTISSALRSLRSRTRSTSAFLVGLDGTAVGDGSTGLPSADDIWYRLEEGRAEGVVRLNGRLALAAASPIEAPDLIGWLVIARSLSATEMERLGNLAAVEMHGAVIAGSELPPILADKPLGRIVAAGDAGHTIYHVSSLPSLDQSVEPRLVLRHSLGVALAQYSALKILLLLVGIMALVLTAILGLRVARGVTRPLALLDDAVRRFGAGEEVALVAETEDEIGRLTNSFNDMVKAIEEREKRILHAGLHDGLTNLPNRRLFAEQLDQALSRRSAEERILIAYCDLDDFKVVNDTLGHPAGDKMLCEVADALRAELSGAEIARLGGDEFAILVKEADPEKSLLDHARRIQACFDRQMQIDGQSADCSASIGIAVAPGDGEDGVDLVKHADLALYRAKREGKATFHFFEPSLDEQARQRREMELDLRIAIKEGQFELYFQPLYSLHAHELKGFEALIRWSHPRKGLINPIEFITLAEETGLILQIGEWVVREACRAAMKWPAHLSVAVNISPKQFGTPGLSAVVMQALTSSGLDPHRLELEITESVFIADVERTLGTLHGLRNVGVKIALDDFGTGYSSLSYLRQFPFDKVKIDQSFVRDLCEQGRNAHAVIRAITTLAEALGMETLAEGVENEEQYRILKNEGCGFVQGYLFSRPLSVTALAAFLERDPKPAMAQAG